MADKNVYKKKHALANKTFLKHNIRKKGVRDINVTKVHDNQAYI